MVASQPETEEGKVQTLLVPKDLLVSVHAYNSLVIAAQERKDTAGNLTGEDPIYIGRDPLTYDEIEREFPDPNMRPPFPYRLYFTTSKPKFDRYMKDLALIRVRNIAQQKYPHLQNIN